MPTTNREDYLRALYIMEERKHDMRSVDLAGYLSVSKPSVSEMVRELSKEGLISYRKYSKIRFTSRGRKVAKNLTGKHRIIELFLKNVIKISSKKVHEEAHRLEHAFSDESISRIRKMLGNPKQDPHGKPIPE